jgi:hypothetical protein
LTLYYSYINTHNDNNNICIHMSALRYKNIIHYYYDLFIAKSLRLFSYLLRCFSIKYFSCSIWFYQYAYVILSIGYFSVNCCLYLLSETCWNMRFKNISGFVNFYWLKIDFNHLYKKKSHNRWPYPILTILCRPFGFLALKEY